MKNDLIPSPIFISKPVRQAILSVDEQTVLAMAICRPVDFKGGRCLLVPDFQLPDDVKVLGVHHNYAARSFDFVLESDTFAPVAPHARLPHVDPILRAVPVLPINDQDAQAFDLSPR